MSHAQIEYEGTWQELALRAPDFEGKRLRLIVLDPEPIDTDYIPVEDRLAALAAQIDPSEWAKLPPDLSDRLDYYIYGPHPE